MKDLKLESNIISLYLISLNEVSVLWRFYQLSASVGGLDVFYWNY